MLTKDPHICHKEYSYQSFMTIERYPLSTHFLPPVRGPKQIFIYDNINISYYLYIMITTDIIEVPETILNEITDYINTLQKNSGISCHLKKMNYKEERYFFSIVEYLRKKSLTVKTFIAWTNEPVMIVSWNTPIYTRRDLKRIHVTHQIQSSREAIDSFMTDITEEILTDVRMGRLDKHIFPPTSIPIGDYPEIVKRLSAIFPDTTIHTGYLEEPNKRWYLVMDWDWNM